MNKPDSDCEIILTRVVRAPRELVWQAWTKPEHVARWWGPRGFTDTTKRHEFRVGGYWEHTMHGPDGTDYPNKAKFLEIVPLERITYLLGGGSDLEGDERRGTTFRATWTFETVEGDKTRLTGRMVFPSKEARDRVVRDFGAIEGGKQTLTKLAEFLPKFAAKPGELVITRTFDAPRGRVWEVWTEVEHMKQWYGPKECTTPVAKMDFRPGGMFHYCMQTADGTKRWGRSVYREIAPPERLVWINSFSDEAGGLAPVPGAPTWPPEMLAVVTFDEWDGKTLLTLVWSAHNASAEERKVFGDNHPSMNQGWTGSLDRLAAYLPLAGAAPA